MSYIPIRRCCVCRAKLPKNELLRIIKTGNGLVELDFTQKKDGRGAYICKCGDCLKNAAKKKALDRSYRQKISSEIYAMLEKIGK